MEHLLRLVLALVLGGCGFGVARLFRLESQIAILIGAVASISALVVSFMGFVKTSLETWKLKLEIGKLRREEADRNSRIHRPTDDEIRRYAPPLLERDLPGVYPVSERGRVDAGKFITDTDEKKLR